MALLCGERVSRSRAITFVRRHGAVGVRRCLNRARQVRAEMEARGKQVANWTGLLCNVLDDPDRYGALVAPVVPAPVAPPSAATPPAEPDVVYGSADVIRLVRALGKGTLKEPHLEALRRRLDGGHEDPQAWGRRLSQAVASGTIVEILTRLRDGLIPASPPVGGPPGQDVLFSHLEQLVSAVTA